MLLPSQETKSNPLDTKSREIPQPWWQSGHNGAEMLNYWTNPDQSGKENVQYYATRKVGMSLVQQWKNKKKPSGGVGVS